jgi:hypothetical protein
VHRHTGPLRLRRIPRDFRHRRDSSRIRHRRVVLRNRNRSLDYRRGHRPLLHGPASLPDTQCICCSRPFTLQHPRMEHKVRIPADGKHYNYWVGPRSWLGLLREREKVYSELPGHDGHGRAAQALGLFYGGTCLTVLITFWYFYEAMRDTSLHSRLSTELETHTNIQTKGYSFMPHTARPLLQSMHTETTRKYSSNLLVREVVTPVYALDDIYAISKGTPVFIYINTSTRSGRPGHRADRKRWLVP